MSLFLYCRYFCPQRQFFFPVNKCEGYWRAQKPVLSTRLVISLSLVAGPKSSDNRKSSFTPFCRLFCRLSFYLYIFFSTGTWRPRRNLLHQQASQPASRPMEQFSRPIVTVRPLRPVFGLQYTFGYTTTKIPTPVFQLDPH